MKKIHAHQLTLMLMLRPKKNSYKEFDNEVNSSLRADEIKVWLRV